jgi:hypothetical protein
MVGPPHEHLVFLVLKLVLAAQEESLEHFLAQLWSAPISD